MSLIDRPLPTFDQTVAADVRLLTAMRADLRAWLVSSGVDGDDCDAAVLACSEALANSIEHAYHGDPSGAVHVSGRLRGDTLELAVSDQGIWVPPGSTPVSIDDSGAVRGRGLRMIEQLMDRTEVVTQDGTTVLMHRRVALGPPAPTPYGVDTPIVVSPPEVRADGVLAHRVTPMTTTTSTGLPAGYRTVTGQIMRYLAMAGGTLTVVQFALAGYGAFSAFQHHRGFGPHETLGSIISVFSLLVLIAALISRPGAQAVVIAVILFILAAPVQPLLADAGKHHAWVGALHAFAGVAILALFGRLSAKLPK